jgi:hypothetical protein
MIQQTIQVIAGTVWVLCASPIANALSPSWWYGLGAVLAGLQLLLSIFLLPETKYHRDETPLVDASEERPKRCTQRTPLDFIRFQKRTWASDMRLWTSPPEWYKAVDVLKVSSPWPQLIHTR